MQQTTINAPLGMLAELTHRCPLQCPYCSNPLNLLKKNRECDTQFWLSLFEEAADLGVLQVHLSGGEPTLRPDLPQLVAALAKRGVYSNLITAGVGIRPGLLEQLQDNGLDHVQLSLQGTDAQTTEKVGNLKGAFEQKMATAEKVRQLGLPLTLNAPLHRLNMHQLPDYVALALDIGAERLEIANVQYAGWALLNRDALMPEEQDFIEQMQFVEQMREQVHGLLNIDYVIPDYYADYPKPCMGGWANDAFVVVPDGMVLPCHAAQTLKHLQFDRYGDKSLAEIWITSQAFNAYRGTEWMKEPCRSCERREIDFGGCRCQALAVAGDASATDPACIKSPLHAKMHGLGEKSAQAHAELIYRRIGAYQEA